MTRIIYTLYHWNESYRKRLEYQPHWSIYIGTAPAAATESTTKYVPYLQDEKYHTSARYFKIEFEVCLNFKKWTVLVLKTHLWQRSPIPSMGWHVPDVDSPCVMNITAGLCSSKA